MGEFVRLERSDGIGTIRLDRPPMNAVNAQVRDELQATATEAAQDETVRAVVVYGGEKVFAAGADIKQMVAMSRDEMTPWAGALSETRRPMLWNERRASCRRSATICRSISSIGRCKGTPTQHIGIEGGHLTAQS